MSDYSRLHREIRRVFDKTERLETLINRNKDVFIQSKFIQLNNFDNPINISNIVTIEKNSHTENHDEKIKQYIYNIQLNTTNNPVKLNYHLERERDLDYVQLVDILCSPEKVVTSSYYIKLTNQKTTFDISKVKHTSPISTNVKGDGYFTPSIQITNNDGSAFNLIYGQSNKNTNEGLENIKSRNQDLKELSNILINFSRKDNKYKNPKLKAI